MKNTVNVHEKKVKKRNRPQKHNSIQLTQVTGNYKTIIFVNVHEYRNKIQKMLSVVKYFFWKM
ncbi:hypothetical protein ABIE50_002650 [Chitinophaga sp. OAE865]